MKKIIALAVVILGQSWAAFGGEPVVSSKEVIAPPPPPPPPEFFRPNEFDIGAFGTYAESVQGGGHDLHGWGGGMDFTYWTSWKYAGFRFQGAGLDVRGGGSRSRVFTFPDGETATVSGGGGSVPAGVVTGDFMLRLPLDTFWTNFHLAPYAFVGVGGIFIGSPGNGNDHEFVERTVFVSRTEGAPATQPVTLRGRALSRLQEDFPGGSQILGHVGIGLEYRFTPHIGIFGEGAYVFPNLSNNNFVQTNFGLRFAF